jgi:hypothetical protein
MVQISSPLETIHIYERGIDLLNVKWVFMADGIPNSLRCFCSLCHKSPSNKNLVQDLEFFEKVRNFFPFQPWTIFPRKLTWKLGSCVQKMAPVHCQSCCFRPNGRGLRVIPSQCDQSGKPLLWHHRGLTISGTLRVWRSSCLASCYGSLGSKTGKTWRQQ